MEKDVVKFTTLSEAKQFCAENADFKFMAVWARTLDNKTPAEKIYIAYNKKHHLCPNNAVLDYWHEKGLI